MPPPPATPLAFARQRRLPSAAIADLIRDLKAQEAAQINHGGLEAQVRYLVMLLGNAQAIDSLRAIQIH